jgi:signal transduction histidine kinase
MYAICSSGRGQGLRLAGPRRSRGFAGDLVPPQPLLLLLLLLLVVVVLRLPLRVVRLVVRRRRMLVLVVVLLQRRNPAAAVAHDRRVPGAGVHGRQEGSDLLRNRRKMLDPREIDRSEWEGDFGGGISRCLKLGSGENSNPFFAPSGISWGWGGGGGRERRRIVES